jgi:hypothetical protein
MASGDYLGSYDCLICFDWSCYAGGTLCCPSNGVTYIYYDGIGGTYCEFSGYCNSGYVFSILCLNDITGNYCHSAISDGTGWFFEKDVYFSGTVLQTNYCCVNVHDFVQCCNGYSELVSDGSGCNYINYFNCNAGYLFYSSGNYEFVSDGFGGYLINELNSRNISEVKIEWDFGNETKNKYFSETLDACGNDLLISFNENSCSFYEINSICDTNIYISEAVANNALSIDSASKPFIYIKNIGCSNLFLTSSRLVNFCCYADIQYSNEITFCNANLKLTPKDYTFISLNASTSGDKYYSVHCFPFNFFYEFKNVCEVNELGLYPVCCYTNNFKFYPNFLYQNLNNLPLNGVDIQNTGLEYCYTKIRSNCFNSYVDNYSCLEISLAKEINYSGFYCCWALNEINNINSNFFPNQFLSTITLDSVYLSENDNYKEILDFNNLIFSKQIDSNLDIKIIYEITYDSCKLYKLFYNDLCSGESIYDISIEKNNKYNEKFIFDKQSILSNTGIFDSICSDEFYVVIDTCDNSAIKDLKNSIINRCNMFLPIKNDFEYCYCYKLEKSNYKITSSSGYWISEYEDIFCSSGFINCSFIIDCSCSEYQANKSCLFNIKLNLSDSRYKTCDILNKNELNISENFNLLRNYNECSFFYCGIEFKYFPTSCISFQDIEYYIKNNFYDFNFCISGCSEIIKIPIDALSACKLKINIDYEVYDSLAINDLFLQYSGLQFYKNTCNLNTIEYFAPIIKTEDLLNYEYPNLLIKNTINTILQKNTTIDFNILKNFTLDENFGLNNFLLFVTSKFNNGVASNFNCNYFDYQCFDLYELLKETNNDIYYWRNPSCEYIFEDQLSIYGNYNDYFNEISGYYTSSEFCEFNVQYDQSGNLTTGYIIKKVKLECSPIYLPCDYQYGTSNYNFLMMDLFTEYNKCNFLIPSGSFINIDLFCSCSNINNNNIIAFKNFTGSGYSYITAIPNNLCYLDCFQYSGINCESGIFISGVIYDINCNFQYNGSYRFKDFLLDENQQVTGFIECYPNCSSLNFLNESVNINISANDISGQSYRCLFLCKNYNFSGVQPFNIKFNYPMVDIKYPIVHHNFKLYCESCEYINLTGSNLYYIYDITGFKLVPISITSPDFTQINLISWDDQCGNKSLYSNYQDKNLGQIYGNAARINFNIDNYIYSNQYLLDVCSLLNLCINIIGEL